MGLLWQHNDSKLMRHLIPPSSSARSSSRDHSSGEGALLCSLNIDDASKVVPSHRKFVHAGRPQLMTGRKVMMDISGGYLEARFGFI